MTDLFVGQRVVCIKDCHDHNGYGDETFPTVGETYHIRDFALIPIGPRLDPRPCIYLKEIENPVRRYMVGFFDYQMMEPPWLSDYFRPLEAKAMEVFRKIAKDVKVGEDA